VQRNASVVPRLGASRIDGDHPVEARDSFGKARVIQKAKA
jgi:hypothetical protein